MKTILHGNIDGYEIITGFADATIDPAATWAKIAPMLPSLPEQLEVNKVTDRLKARRQKLIDEFSGIFGHIPDELRSPAEGDWYGKAVFEMQKDLEAIMSLLQEPMAALEIARKALFDANAVYFKPTDHEDLIEQDEFDRLMPLFRDRVDGTQVDMSGAVIADNRGKTIYNKSDWSAWTISRLGDDLKPSEVFETDLTDDDRSTMASTRESVRIAALTPEQRASERQMLIDSLAAQAARQKDEAIIKGTATDIAMRDAQAWFKAESERVEQKYS